MTAPTFEEVSRLLSYDAETGLLRWKVRRGSRAAGAAAGSLSVRGGLVIGIHGVLYYAHRVAWLLSTGKWPVVEIDHINRNPLDNRLINLRLATRSENERNKPKSPRNRSGFKGVFWDNARQMWRAEISINRQRFHLGRFSSATEAFAAYTSACLKFHGEFARVA